MVTKSGFLWLAGAQFNHPETATHLHHSGFNALTIHSITFQAVYELNIVCFKIEIIKQDRLLILNAVTI